MDADIKGLLKLSNRKLQALFGIRGSVIRSILEKAAIEGKTKISEIKDKRG